MKKTVKTKIIATVLSAITLVSAMGVAGCNKNTAKDTPKNQTSTSSTQKDASSVAQTSDSTSPSDTNNQQPSTAKLEYWTEGSETAKSIEDYVRTVTDPNSEKFIPVEERIVVSDLDGTLIGELFPAYFDYCMFVHRALYDENYNAPEDMKEFAHELEESFKTRTLPKGSETIHAKYAALAYKDMTIDELKEYTFKFMESDAEGFTNLKRGEAYYKPMKSLVDYLRANDFTVYICSGTDRTLVRALVEKMFDIPANNVIGTDTTMVASGQGDTDGLEYVYQPDDKVIFGGEFITKNLKMNKVAVIEQEIGIVPVLALGNSSGDLSMAQYTVQNDKYEGRAYILLCDDTEREYGKPDSAKSLKETCDKNGFYTVSMKNDFATIYGDNVTLDNSKAEEELPLAA